MKEFEIPVCELVMLDKSNVISTSLGPEKEETPRDNL